MHLELILVIDFTLNPIESNEYLKPLLNRSCTPALILAQFLKSMEMSLLFSSAEINPRIYECCVQFSSVQNTFYVCMICVLFSLSLALSACMLLMQNVYASWISYCKFHLLALSQSVIFITVYWMKLSGCRRTQNIIHFRFNIKWWIVNTCQCRNHLQPLRSINWICKLALPILCYISTETNINLIRNRNRNRKSLCIYTVHKQENLIGK